MPDLLVVLTCPRLGKGLSYLPKTVQLLDEEGADEADRKLILSDGVFEDAPGATSYLSRAGRNGGARPWDVLSLPGPSGSAVGVWRAFDLALREGYDRLLFVEDDVEPCKNAVRRMLRSKVPDDVAFVVFFDMADFEFGVQMTPGIYRIPGTGQKGFGFWGHQATLVPRRTLAWFCTELPLSALEAKAPGERGDSDILMGELTARSHWGKYGKHLPSIVEHIGDVSRIRGAAWRRAMWYPGRYFDALSLPEFQ